MKTRDKLKCHAKAFQLGKFLFFIPLSLAVLWSGKIQDPPIFLFCYIQGSASICFIMTLTRGTEL